MPANSPGRFGTTRARCCPARIHRQSPTSAISLAARVQRAALACDDPVALSHFAATQTGGNDVQVLRALLRATPTDSPRRSAISARIAVLDRVYG